MRYGNVIIGLVVATISAACAREAPPPPRADSGSAQMIQRLERLAERPDARNPYQSAVRVEAIRAIEITWPAGGRTATYTGVEMDRAYHVREGAATLTPIGPS